MATFLRYKGQSGGLKEVLTQSVAVKYMVRTVVENLTGGQNWNRGNVDVLTRSVLQNQFDHRKPEDKQMNIWMGCMVSESR